MPSFCLSLLNAEITVLCLLSGSLMYMHELIHPHKSPTRQIPNPFFGKEVRTYIGSHHTAKFAQPLCVREGAEERAGVNLTEEHISAPSLA